MFSPDFGGSFQNCLFLYGRLFHGFNWQFWVRREPYVDWIWIPETAPFAIFGPKLPRKDTLIVDGSLDIWRTFLIKLVETHHFYHNSDWVAVLGQGHLQDDATVLLQRTRHPNPRCHTRRGCENCWSKALSTLLSAGFYHGVLSFFWGGSVSGNSENFPRFLVNSKFFFLRSIGFPIPFHCHQILGLLNHCLKSEI